MELIVILLVSFTLVTSDNNSPEPKDNNQLKEAKVIQIKEAEPKPVQIKEAEPKLAQEEAKESSVSKEGLNWLNIFLYALGAIVVILTGIYYLTRKATVHPIAAVDPSRRAVDEETQEPQVETQEPQAETQEPQSVENNEENSSEDKKDSNK